MKVVAGEFAAKGRLDKMVADVGAAWNGWIGVMRLIHNRIMWDSMAVFWMVLVDSGKVLDLVGWCRQSAG